MLLPEAVGVRNFKAEFSGVALRQQWESNRRNPMWNSRSKCHASGGISMPNSLAAGGRVTKE